MCNVDKKFESLHLFYEMEVSLSKMLQNLHKILRFHVVYACKQI